jgi:hypothetical protein
MRATTTGNKPGQVLLGRRDQRRKKLVQRELLGASTKHLQPQCCCFGQKFRGRSFGSSDKYCFFPISSFGQERQKQSKKGVCLSGKW